MDVCVIGAGPSGLVCAKTLLERGYSVVVYESTDSVGGAFRWKSYANCRLVSSKYITSFSDFRMSSEHEHPSIPEYVAYLERYAAHFELHAVIQFGCAVRRVRRRGDAYDVQLLGESTQRRFDAVAVCSGLHNVPYIPAALRDFSGTMLHSAEYKTDAPFKNRDVLIVGAGETGMDVAYQAVGVAKSVHLCIRNGFLSVPHQIGSVALDTLISNVGECAYQHRWVEDAKLRWWISTFFIRVGLFLGSGTSRGYSQWAATASPVKRGHHIINKQCKAMPYINRPFKAKSPCWARIWRGVGEVDDASLPAIALHNCAISSVQGVTVTFADGSHCAPDVLLLATGYRQRFPFLHAARGGERRRDAGRGDSSGDADVSDDPLPPIRLICSEEEPNLAYIGFVRPNVGAIPPMSELQTLWWIERMEGRLAGKRLAAPTFKLLSHNTRTKAYAVDYGAYMHDLARDCGAAPDLFGRGTGWWWWTHPRALLTYAIGQAYVGAFRLHGPFAPTGVGAVEEMRRVYDTELWSTIVRRGLCANVVFSAVAVAFSMLNLAVLIVELALRACRIV